MDSLNKTKASSITIADSLAESVRLQASLDQVYKYPLFILSFHTVSLSRTPWQNPSDYRLHWTRYTDIPYLSPRSTLYHYRGLPGRIRQTTGFTGSGIQISLIYPLVPHCITIVDSLAESVRLQASLDQVYRYPLFILSISTLYHYRGLPGRICQTTGFTGSGIQISLIYPLVPHCITIADSLAESVRLQASLDQVYRYPLFILSYHTVSLSRTPWQNPSGFTGSGIQISLIYPLVPHCITIADSLAESVRLHWIRYTDIPYLSSRLVPHCITIADSLAESVRMQAYWIRYTDIPYLSSHSTLYHYRGLPGRIRQAAGFSGSGIQKSLIIPPANEVWGGI